jgi:hypothetical protein
MITQEAKLYELHEECVGVYYIIYDAYVLIEWIDSRHFGLYHDGREVWRPWHGK